MKKMISIIITIFIIMTGFCYASSGDTSIQDAYNQGYNDGYNDGSSNVYEPKTPKIIFVEDKKMPEVKADENFNLTITYKNDSEYNAYDVKITPIFENSILEYERPTYFQTNKSLRRDREDKASFNLKIKATAKLGIYELKFKLEFRDNNDQNHTGEASIYVKVVEEKLKSMITIDNIVTNPGQVVAGEQFALSFNINNIGDIGATDMYVKLNNLSQDTFMALDSKDFIYIGKLGAKSTYTPVFTVLTSKNIVKGNNTLGATVYYKDSDGNEVSVEKTIYILDVISNKDSENETAGKPKIMIESYSTNKNNIIAGDTINFTFKFKNTSKERNISNMVITLNSTEGAFMITKGSNTFYVETLAPGESATKSIELDVRQDLSSKSYPIDIDFDYEDATSKSYTAKEVINLPVTEYSKLVINNAYVMDSIVGNQTSLSFDYVNMGRARVSNLTATVEGDFTPVQSVNYIGNLEAGSSDYYDIMVTPNKEGDLSGTLVLAFEDSSGKTITVKKEFASYAMPAFVPDGNQMGDDKPYGGDDWSGPIEEPKEPLAWWQIALAGVGSFLIAFFITKIITTKIVRKKLENEI